MDHQFKTKNNSLELANESSDISSIVETANEMNVVFVRLQFVDILGTPKNIIIPTGRLDRRIG